MKMSPQFSITEEELLKFAQNTKDFVFKGERHNIKFVGKPYPSQGECKTDLFIKTDKGEFKISIKQSNADFIENKMSYERAIQIFGDKASEIISKSIKSIKSSFDTHPLICFEKKGRTQAKTIVLGWKFELVNKVNGKKSGLLELSDEQKMNIYSGHLSDESKRNAVVNGEIIEDSGVANFILVTGKIENEPLQYFIDKLEPINEFAKKQSIYFACKALNYRMLEDKWDGNRPLGVFVDWQLNDKKQLSGTIVYDNPLQTKGNAVGENVRSILSELSINKSNFNDLKRFYKGPSYPCN